MTTKTTRPPLPNRDLGAEISFLTRALKAPTMREAVPRLAERARAKSWTHEEFLVACFQREVSARGSHGGEGLIRAARFTQIVGGVRLRPCPRAQTRSDRPSWNGERHDDYYALVEANRHPTSSSRSGSWSCNPARRSSPARCPRCLSPLAPGPRSLC